MRSTSKNRRVRVAETIGDTVGLSVATQVRGSARSNGADAAFALASALNGGARLSARRDADLTRQAEADFQQGNVDESIGNRNYRNRVNQLTAEAQWLEDRENIRAKLRDVDLANVSQQELDEFLDNEYRSLYGGLELEDRAVQDVLVPRLQQFRQQVYQQAAEVQLEAETREIGSSLTQIAEEAYTNQGESGFSYEELHAKARSVLPNGAELNEVYFNLIKDIAIRNGDPDLIRNMPERWEGGVPTFAIDPKFNERVLNAELRAEQARVAKITQAAREADALDKENLNRAGLAAWDFVSNGQFAEAQQMVQLYRELPGADYTSVIALDKAMESLQSTAEERAADELRAGAVTLQVYSGDITAQQLFTEFAVGTFGAGKQATQRFASLARALTSQEGADGGTQRAYTQYAKSIRDSYRPDRNGPLEAIDSTLAEIQRVASLEYYQLVHEQGADPADAYQQVIEKYDPRKDRAFTIKESQAFATPAEAIDAFVSGQISVSRAREANVDVDAVQEALDNQAITAEQAIQLLDNL